MTSCNVFLFVGRGLPDPSDGKLGVSKLEVVSWGAFVVWYPSFPLVPHQQELSVVGVVGAGPLLAMHMIRQ